MAKSKKDDDEHVEKHEDEHVEQRPAEPTIAPPLAGGSINEPQATSQFLTTGGSINEPGPDQAPKASEPELEPTDEIDAEDPDELEDEIERAIEDGEVIRGHKPAKTKSKAKK